MALEDDLREIVDDTLSRYWEATRRREITKPIRWMLITARNIRKERNRRRTSTSALPENADPIMKPNSAGTPIDLTGSTAWMNLSSQQQHVLGETIMFDRSVTEVAREVGICRSTAKSWKQRLPARLAGDCFLIDYLNQTREKLHPILDGCESISNN